MKPKCLFSTRSTDSRFFSPIITIDFFNSQIRFYIYLFEMSPCYF